MSALRSFSQVPTRADNLVVLGSATDGAVDSAVETMLASNAAATPPVAVAYDGTIVDFKTIANADTFLALKPTPITALDNIAIGTILRDLGKRIRFTVNGQEYETWTRVQIIKKIAAAGAVPAYEAYGNGFYVVTFSSSPATTASVARLG